MSAPIRPQFFCSRPNGTLTPLVAVDELPTHMSIRGTPRVLSPSETQGMTSLGTVNGRAQNYIVDGVFPPRVSAGNGNANRRSRDFELQASLARVMADENIPANQRLALQAVVHQGLAQNWPVSGASPNNWVVPSAPAGGKNSHANAKKEYCSYWIRHGECDYQQQGCLYKHEMPTEPAILEKLGLRDIPRWYRDKYGMPSIQVNGHRGHMGHGHGHAQQWKEDNDRGAFKAIQYAPRSGINGNNDSAEFEKPKHKPGHLPVQHSGLIPDQPRAFGSVNGGVNGGQGGARKHGPKHMGNQHHPNGGKKIDLLSFDPLPDYANLEGNAGAMTDLTFYSADGDSSFNEDPDRVQREGFVRHLQSLAPGHADTNMQSPFEAASSQARSKRTHRSRRLYQRANTNQSTVADGTNGVEDTTTMNASNVFRGPLGTTTTTATSSFPALTSATSTLSKASNHSHLTSPLGGLGLGGGMGGGIGSTAFSSGSPTREVSPENLSHSSMSTHSSPLVSSRFRREDAFGPVKYSSRPHSPGAIGTKRVHPKESAGLTDDEVFGLSMGRK